MYCILQKMSHYGIAVSSESHLQIHSVHVLYFGIAVLINLCKQRFVSTNFYTACMYKHFIISYVIIRHIKAVGKVYLKIPSNLVHRIRENAHNGSLEPHIQ